MGQDQLDRIEATVNQTQVDMGVVKTTLKMHMGEENIHHTTPCKASEKIDSKLWGLTVGVLLSLAAGVWNFLSK